jgi:peptidoglycan/LPS O-acetylase OafA/YrhL
MGLLRFLLATCVVATHSNGHFLYGYEPFDGVLAVYLFFVVSGFYMSLILAKKYVGPGAARVFLGNRVLRLWPGYLAAVAVSALVTNDYFQQMAVELSRTSIAVISLLDIVPLGMDLAIFCGINPSGDIDFSIHGISSKHLLSYALVPQAWSLSLELMFYLVAPFVVTRAPRTLLVFVVALAIDALMHSGGYSPYWAARSFFSVLPLFMVGALSYHAGQYIVRSRSRYFYECFAVYILYPITLLFILYPPAFRAVPFPQTSAVELFVQDPRLFLLILICVAGMPGWMNRFSSFRGDDMLGKLSYPIFVMHLAAFEMLRSYADLPFLGVLIMAVTLILSFAVLWVIERPIEHIRQRQVNRLRYRYAEPAQATYS